MEGYHPLSSYLFFRIDKTCFSLEHATHGDQLLYVNLTNKSTSIFEPNVFLIPYNEFRCVITIYLTQSLDEPYQLEFMVDATEFKLNSEIKTRNLEANFRNQDGNNVRVGIQGVLDVNSEYTGAVNYKIPISDANPASPSFRADFTRSTFFILKYIMIDLPLKRANSTRQEQSTKQAEPTQNKVTTQPAQMDKWNHSAQLDEFSAPQPNPKQSKMTLNPDAPHFSFQQQGGAGESTFGKIYGPQAKAQAGFPGMQYPQMTQQQYFQQQQAQKMDPQFMYHQDDQPQSDEGNEVDEDDGNVGYVERSLSGHAFPNFGGNPDIQRFNSASNMGDNKLKINTGGLNKRTATNFSITSNSSEGTSPNITPRQSQAELPSVGSMERILFGDEKLPEDALESFKLEDYKGKLVEFSKTHNGSRILQKFFPRANQQEIDMVISELSDRLEEIMLDSYANYMFQTLAQSCSSEQRYRLLQKIAPLMPKVACDRKGTHSLQALISIINRDEEEQLIEENLVDHVLMLSKDPQGTHFIQKLVNSISLARINFIFDAVVQEFQDLANNSYGLCVLKALITKIQKQEDKKWLIIQLVSDNVDNLIQNPYGNYAIQHTFETFKDDCASIWEKILDKIFQLSNQKFSSNVIEKCLTTSNEENKKRFISEVVKSERIVELMKNKYGNFVLIKIFSVSDENDKARLVEAIQKYVNAVHVTKYKTKWLTFLDENKNYLKSTKTNRFAPGPGFYPGDKGQQGGSQQVNVNQFPESTGGPPFRGNTGSFTNSQFQGFPQQNVFPGYNQYPNQGFGQTQGPGYSMGTGYGTPTQNTGYNPTATQTFNPGFNQNYKGNAYFTPQQNIGGQGMPMKKQQGIGGGGGMYGGFPTSGGSYPYDSPSGGGGSWNPMSSGYQQSNFPQGGYPQQSSQGKKPMNYGGFFDNQKKF